MRQNLLKAMPLADTTEKSRRILKNCALWEQPIVKFANSEKNDCLKI
jgi:hypothetical protein